MNIVNDKRFDACPLCKSEKIVYLSDIEYYSPIQFSTLNISLEFKPTLWKCSCCKSWFTQNIVREEIALELYTQGSSADKWPRKAIEQTKTKDVLAVLHKLYRRGLQVLDIGCNTGELLDFARGRGALTTGIEVSTVCMNVVRNKGHLFALSIEETSDNYFDVITAFDLVEHLYNVPMFLTACYAKLKSGGSLVILTGDISSLSALICRSKWWYLKAPEHIIFPSTLFFKIYSGFRIERVLSTYASVEYDEPFIELVRGVYGGLRRHKYNGIPSLGPDHSLLILRKPEAS